MGIRELQNAATRSRAAQNSIVSRAAQTCSAMLWSLFLLLGKKLLCSAVLVLEGGPRRQENISIHFFPLAAVNYSLGSTDLMLGKGFPVHYLPSSSEAFHF